MTFDSVDLTLGRPLKFAIVLNLACDDLQLTSVRYARRVKVSVKIFFQ